MKPENFGRSKRLEGSFLDSPLFLSRASRRQFPTTLVRLRLNCRRNRLPLAKEFVNGIEQGGGDYRLCPYVFLLSLRIQCI